jgi:sarcosine oxidase subunit alpha
MRIKKAAGLLPALTRGKTVPILVNGAATEAYEGETVATVLLAAGIWGLRHTRRSGEPRGVYCGMGVCFECLVTVDGVHAVRACLTPVRAGMHITTHEEVTL